MGTVRAVALRESSGHVAHEPNMKPLLRAGVATVGTFVVIGGATVATSAAVMAVVRAAVNQRKVSANHLCVRESRAHS